MSRDTAIYQPYCGKFFVILLRRNEWEVERVAVDTLKKTHTIASNKILMQCGNKIPKINRKLDTGKIYNFLSFDDDSCVWVCDECCRKKSLPHFII